MTNLESIFKSRDNTLPTKVRLVKAMVFPVVMDGCESWTVKKAKHRRIDAFELWCWRRLLRVPWTARRANQSILKEVSPGISLEGMMLKLKLQEFTQTHVHRVSDAIQPSDPRWSPSPPAPNPSQHQSLLQWVNLRMKWPKYWSFNFSIIPSKEIPGLISFRMDWLDLLQSKGHSRVFSNTTVQKHQIFGAQPSSQSNSHIHTWPQEKL